MGYGMKSVVEILGKDDGNIIKQGERETKRSCSLGLEFLLRKGTPKSLTEDGTPCFPEAPALTIYVVDYAGSEDDVLPSAQTQGVSAKSDEAWFEKNLKHTLPRASDLDKLCVLLHCKNMTIASTVEFMMNGSASVNEFSARYAELPAAQISKTDLQEMMPDVSKSALDSIAETLKKYYHNQYNHYKELVQSGVTKELSRGILPTSQHTEFYTKLSLFHLIKFLQIYGEDPLMNPAIAQLEIIFNLAYPKIYKLFKGGALKASEKLWADFVRNDGKKQTTYRLNSDNVEQLFEEKQIISHENETPLDGHKCWVKITDYLGTIKTPYQAVGMSFGVEENPSSEKTVESLINLLISLGHGSPFELPTLFFTSKVPFFVFRHLIRHRTMGIYQWSFVDDRYVPTVRAETGKELSKMAQTESESYGEMSYSESQKGCLELRKLGLPEDLCSLIYPVNRYVEFSGRVDIHNLVHFLALRTNPAAQYETRMFAKALKGLFEQWVPAIYKAFVANKRLQDDKKLEKAA
ncbi:hypothetical protein AGMMS49949_00700 [Alphaproteobacteria bacterium]|nr:hypothetical protein AGMMS49949_00700 [Alphaproteobacteria bacterium]GHS96206.1 hypothetical protein AGMMS50296_2140 [Alphaproteobacteria bacterium]